MEFIIEKASFRDFSDAMRLEKICFDEDRWTILDLTVALSDPYGAKFKALQDKEFVGFVASEREKNQDVEMITTLGVSPASRNQGIGTALLRSCESAAHCKTMRLFVKSDNETALSLYSTMGYHRVGKYENYYGGHHDAIIMEKIIEK